MSNPVIQRVPPGLLGWLGIKNGGSAPQDLGQQIVPNLDTLDWYLMSSLEVVATTITTPTVGINQFTNHTVPAGEWWYVHDHAIRLFATAAGDTMTATAAVLMNSGTSIGIAYAGDYVTNPAGVASFTSASTRRQGFFLRPGDQAVFLANSVTGTVRAVLTTLITRLPI